MEPIIVEGERWVKKYLKPRALTSVENSTSIFDQEKWALYKSTRNMLDFYRTELLELMKGRSIVNLIPKGTRKSFVEQGVLRKFGSKFELTDMGMEMLRARRGSP